MNHKITPAIVAHIKEQRNLGVRWGVLSKETGFNLGLLRRCVEKETHFCKKCGDRIVRGEYCYNKIECRRERLNQYFRDCKQTNREKGKRQTLSPQKEDYIKRRVKAGYLPIEVARELKISCPTVREHYLGIRKTHVCVVCGDAIRWGKYCLKLTCIRTRRRKYLAGHPDKKEDKQRKQKAWADSHPNRKPLHKFVCSTCGRIFLRHPGNSYQNVFCSRLCFDNYRKAKVRINRRLENITVLSGQIVKEKPVLVEKVESIGSLMRKAPESEEHMKA